MYFNAKHDHSGTLFQGRFKSAHIDSNPYFQYIFQYIHLNPLELFESGWKERGIRDTKGAEQFLQQFRWSSHYDYTIDRRPERSILHMQDVVEGTSVTDAIEFVRGDIKDRPLY
jgi:hypothetical protein